MASAIIHLCVAKEINKYLKMDENYLLLGSIAPDISKQIGETKEIMRWGMACATLLVKAAITHLI